MNVVEDISEANLSIRSANDSSVLLDKSVLDSKETNLLEKSAVDIEETNDSSGLAEESTNLIYRES